VGEQQIPHRRFAPIRNDKAFFWGAFIGTTEVVPFPVDGGLYGDTKAPVIGRGFMVVENWNAACEASLG